MKGQETLFSSASGEWETPPKLFNYLNSRFAFEVDAAATRENAKCAAFFSSKDAVDGLRQVWAPKRVFLNPPYGREVGKWVAKAHFAAQRGALVVCLLPVRSDTAWFAAFCSRADEIWFLRKRLRFVGATNSAPFPSMIVVFLPRSTAITPVLRVLEPSEWERA